jgi:hypothetical protein
MQIKKFTKKNFNKKRGKFWGEGASELRASAREISLALSELTACAVVKCVALQRVAV